MQVSLYIGHHKVGSTSLQIFLSQNYTALLRAGLLYPYTEMRGAAHAVRAVLRGDRVEMPSVNVREPHSALAYKMMSDASGFTVPAQFQMLPHSNQMFHAMRTQIRELEPRGVILCSEAFSNFGMVNPALVTLLTSQFGEAGFTVYCALRRPDDYMLSWHNQRIKVREVVPALSRGAWRQYVDTIHFDYRLAVEAWLKRTPNSRLHLRTYDEVKASGGSEADFMAHSGLTFPKDLLPAENANKGLPVAVLELARRGNAELELPDARQLRQFLMSLDGVIPLTRSADVECYGQENREEIHALFAPIQDWLSNVSGKRAFFPDFDDILKPRPVPEREALRLALDQMGDDLLEPLSEGVRAFIDEQRVAFRP